MVRPTVPTVDELRPHSAGLMFRQPSPESTTSPSDLPETEDLQSDPWSSPSQTTDSAGEPDLSPAQTSSRASSAEPVLSKAAIRDAARHVVIGVGETLHEALARDEVDQQVGLWLTTEGDAENIGDPLARIVARRDPLGAAGNPDVADALAAAVGLAVFGYRQLRLWNAARRIRRAGRIAEETAAAGAEAA